MIEKITIASLSGRGSVTIEARDYIGYWLIGVDWGTVEGSHNTYANYNQVGENIVSTTVGTRPVSITGMIVERDGTMQSRCDFLNTFLSPVEDYELEYGSKKIRIRPDSSIRYSRPYKENNEIVRRFLIQATAANPLFTDAESTVSSFDENSKLFRFPNNLGVTKPVVFGLVAKNFTTIVTNPGGYETGLTARVTFYGTVQSPIIRSLTTGEYIQINRTFSSGERMELCTVPGSKYIRLLNYDGGTTNLMRYRDYRTSWIQLKPGDNTISIESGAEGEAWSMEAEILFTPLYMEVE